MTIRRIKDVGLNPIFTVLLSAFGFIILSIYIFAKSEFAVYVYLLFALVLIGRLSESKRTEFLKICLGDTQMKKIRLIENLICTTPFLIFLIYKHYFPYAALLWILAAILALVHFKTSLNFTIWTPFSKRPFEFTTGFRNSLFLLLGTYVLTLIAISVKNFNLGVFAMLLVFATTLSYYAKPENEYFVWIYNLDPKQFLLEKIRTGILFSSVLALPIVISLSFFFYQNLGLTFLIFFIGWAYLINMIVSKYSAFPDEMNIIQGFLFALSLWFPPLLIVMIPYFFKKSEKRLSSLLQ